MFVQNNLIAAAVLVCSLGLAAPSMADVPANELRAAVDKAIALVKPALVQIHVVESYYREGRENKYQISGSGVVVTPKTLPFAK